MILGTLNQLAVAGKPFKQVSIDIIELTNFLLVTSFVPIRLGLHVIVMCKVLNEMEIENLGLVVTCLHFEPIQLL